MCLIIKDNWNWQQISCRWRTDIWPRRKYCEYRQYCAACDVITEVSRALILAHVVILLPGADPGGSLGFFAPWSNVQGLCPEPRSRQNPRTPIIRMALRAHHIVAKTNPPCKILDPPWLHCYVILLDNQTLSFLCHRHAVQTHLLQLVLYLLLDWQRCSHRTSDFRGHFPPKSAISIQRFGQNAAQW